MSERLSFDNWIDKVEAIVADRLDLTLFDFEYDYHEMYEDGLTPDEAYHEVIETFIYSYI